MIAEKKAALLETGTAAKNKFHKEPYLKAEPLSSLKIKIGQECVCWQRKEITLCASLDQEILQDGHNEAFSSVESKNIKRGYIG